MLVKFLIGFTGALAAFFILVGIAAIYIIATHDRPNNDK